MVAVPPICPVISLPLVAAVDAIAWRLRGADEAVRPLGNTGARLLAAAMTATACWLFCGLALVNAVWLAAALFIGSTLPWWGSLDVSNARDVAMHSGTCLLRVLPAALLLWQIGGLWWPLLLAGALGGPVYLAARLLRGGDFVPVAELAWGAVRGAAIAGGITWVF